MQIMHCGIHHDWNHRPIKYYTLL